MGFGYKHTITETFYLQNDYGLIADSATLPSGERDALLVSDMTAGPGLRARLEQVSFCLEAEFGLSSCSRTTCVRWTERRGAGEALRPAGRERSAN
jgi:hypothetical protein